MKINHNELLSLSELVRPDDVRLGAARVRDGRGRASARRSTSAPTQSAARSSRSARRSRTAHALGLFTVLWCYLRNPAFKQDGVDYNLAADLTGQANHLGVTIEADIIKQKLPENNGGYGAAERGREDVRPHEHQGLLGADDRSSDRPHALPGRQLLHGPRAADQQRRRLGRARAISRRRCAPR